MREAYGTGTGLVFLVAAVASLVTLLAVLLIKEVPLRRTVDIVEVDPATGRLKVVTRTLDAREVRRRQEAAAGAQAEETGPGSAGGAARDRVRENTSTGPVDRV